MHVFRFFIIITISMICLVGLYSFSFAAQVQGVQQSPIQQNIQQNAPSEMIMLPEMYFVCPDTLPMGITYAPKQTYGWETPWTTADDKTAYLDMRRPMDINESGWMVCHYILRLGQYLPGASGATNWDVFYSIKKTPPPDYSCQIDTSKQKTFVCKKKTPKPPYDGPPKKR
jgi:hypothetical protein